MFVGCFGLDVFSDINISTQPLISPSQAYQFSIQDIAFSIEEYDQIDEYCKKIDMDLN